MGDRLPPRRPRGPMLQENKHFGEYVIVAVIFGVAAIGGVAVFVDRVTKTADIPVPPLSATLLTRQREARESCGGVEDGIFKKYACRRALHGMISYLSEDRLESVALADFNVRAERAIGHELREGPRRVRPRRPIAKFSPGVDAVWRLQRAEQLEEKARRYAPRDPARALEDWREAREVYERLLESAAAFEKALKTVPPREPEREKAAALVSEAAGRARARVPALKRAEAVLSDPRALEAFGLAARELHFSVPDACARLRAAAEAAPGIETVQFEAGRLCFASDPKAARAALERGLAAYARGPVDPRTDARDAEMARQRLAALGD